ncbi:hypothetical protein SAMN05216351_10598 [Pseudobutyrivibrio sp. JW11]|nr:hypothetical protein SAMN05216351_10598 [Pseudobutyrivibrio sp. JW11]
MKRSKKHQIIAGAILVVVLVCMVFTTFAAAII